MAECGLLLALRRGDASFLDLLTGPFESGMPRVVLQSRGVSWGILRVQNLFLTLPTHSTLHLGLVTTPSRFRTHLHKFLSNISYKLMLICVHCQIQKAGSRTHKGRYYIGYLQTVVPACVHLLFSQYLRHPIFGRFLLISNTLFLEPPGPRFSKPHRLSLSVLWNQCL